MWFLQENLECKVSGTVSLKRKSHSARNCRGNVVPTSLCTFQQRLVYFSNEAPNNVLVERHQDVSANRLHEVLLELRGDVSRGRNNEVPSVNLDNISNKFQTKHPKAS